MCLEGLFLLQNVSFTLQTAVQDITRSFMHSGNSATPFAFLQQPVITPLSSHSTQAATSIYTQSGKRSRFTIPCTTPVSLISANSPQSKCRHFLLPINFQLLVDHIIFTRTLIVYMNSYYRQSQLPVKIELHLYHGMTPTFPLKQDSI